MNTLKSSLLAKHCNLQPSHLSNTLKDENNATTVKRSKNFREEVIELHSAIDLQDIAYKYFL